MNTINTIFSYADAANLGDNFAFGSIKTIGEGIGYLIMPGFMVAGIIMAAYFIWGALDMIISEGEKEKVAAAKRKMEHVIIGFILLLFAFLITQFLPKFLGLGDLVIVGK